MLALFYIEKDARSSAERGARARYEGLRVEVARDAEEEVGSW